MRTITVPTLSTTASLPATGINPASFPLGSNGIGGRNPCAAAALLRFCDDDLDALVLYAGAVYLDSRMKPNYREREATDAYQRGAELCRQRRGTTLLAHLDQLLGRSTLAEAVNVESRGQEMCWVMKMWQETEAASSSPLS
jgi:hypothetical protein